MASCVFLHGGLPGRRSQEILNARALLYILMYPQLWRFTVWPPRSVVVYLPPLPSLPPFAGWPEPHFADLFQLINKLTDLPYPSSHVAAPKVTLRGGVTPPTLHSNRLKKTIPISGCYRHSDFVMLVTWYNFSTIAGVCVCVPCYLIESPSLKLISFFHCRWCHTF